MEFNDLTFMSGSDRACSFINIVNDDILESNETFMVMLQSTLQVVEINSDANMATVTITDDDGRFAFTIGLLSRVTLCTLSF